MSKIPKKGTLARHKYDAKVVFQRWIRMRDADENGYVTCCCCGKIGFWKGDGFDAGHFVPATSMATCFDPRNVHTQCKGCNGFGMKYGHANHEYDEFMQERYGREVIIELRGKRFDAVKRTKQEYDEIKEFYEDACVGMEMVKNL